MTVPTKVSDAEIFALLDRMYGETGKVPGRNELVEAAHIGGGRASRLLRVWKEGERGGQEQAARGAASHDTDDGAAAEAAEGNGTGARSNGHHRDEPEQVAIALDTRPRPLWVEQHRADAEPEQTEEGAGDEPALSDRDQGELFEADRTEVAAEKPAGPVREPVRQSERGQDPVAAAPDGRHRKSTWLFILGAVVGLIVSVDTSWRFFGEVVGIERVWERVAMFAGVEILLVACAVAMYEGVRSERKSPGPARWLAWALCAVSAYAALTLAGWPVGPARVLLGPVLSVVAFHHALGIELRARTGRRTGAWARLAAELRERLMSRLGLADDGRDAAERTRWRAARRTAKLARASKWTTPFRQARRRRAMRLADVAHQDRMREVMLAELRTLEHADKLDELKQSSPWESVTDPA